jgi:hypothetical protein
MTPLLIIVIEDREPTGDEWVRRRIASLCDAHLSMLLDVAGLRCLLTPNDPAVWFLARAAEDEYTRRGLIDGMRL